MPANHAPRHELLLIHDRTAPEPSPHGHAVACPQSSWVSIVECLGCQELADIRFDPGTNATFIECAPTTIDPEGPGQ